MVRQKLGQHLLIVHDFHYLLVILHFLDLVLEGKFEVVTFLVLHHHDRVSALLHLGDRLFRVRIELQHCGPLAVGQLQVARLLEGVAAAGSEGSTAQATDLDLCVFACVRASSPLLGGRFRQSLRG